MCSKISDVGHWNIAGSRHRGRLFENRRSETLRDYICQGRMGRVMRVGANYARPYVKEEVDRRAQ